MNGKEIGQALRSARLSSGKKTIEIARDAGVSRSTLNRAERGEDVTVDTLNNIARALGIELTIQSSEAKEVSP